MATAPLRPDIKIRGIRQSMPSGYVLGRTDAGNGPPHLIALSKLGGQRDKTVGTVGGGGGATNVGQLKGFFFLGVQAAGKPFANRDLVPCGVTPANVLFPSATAPAGRSVAKALNPPTANCNVILTDNPTAYILSGTHIICTVAFSAGLVAGTLTYGTPGVISAGTVLYLVLPATADATLGNLDILFCGDKS